MSETVVTDHGDLPTKTAKGSNMRIGVTVHAIERWQERVNGGHAAPDVYRNVLRIATEGAIHRKLGVQFAGHGNYFATHPDFPDAVVVLRQDQTTDGRFVVRTVYTREMCMDEAYVKASRASRLRSLAGLPAPSISGLGVR